MYHIRWKKSSEYKGLIINNFKGIYKALVCDELDLKKKPYFFIDLIKFTQIEYKASPKGRSTW